MRLREVLKPLAIVGALLLIALPSTGRAQDASSLDWSAIPYIGIAQRSPVGSEWGIAADRNHLFLGVQLETSLLRIGRARILYAPNVTPLVRLSHTPSAGSADVAQDPRYGVGFAPFGLALRLPLAGDIEVFGGGAVGALWFSSAVPVPDARAFNVTIEWGGGLDLPVGHGHTMRVGYKFHHLSNVYSAPLNPGVDGHVFYTGWRFAVKVPR